MAEDISDAPWWATRHDRRQMKTPAVNGNDVIPDRASQMGVYFTSLLKKKYVEKNCWRTAHKGMRTKMVDM